MKDRTLKDGERREGIAGRNMHSIYNHHYHHLYCLRLIFISIKSIHDVTVFGLVMEHESDLEFLNGHIVQGM
jgi:hypothetical protein